MESKHHLSILCTEGLPLPWGQATHWTPPSLVHWTPPSLVPCDAQGLGSESLLLTDGGLQYLSRSILTAHVYWPSPPHLSCYQRKLLWWQIPALLRSLLVFPVFLLVCSPHTCSVRDGPNQSLDPSLFSSSPYTWSLAHLLHLRWFLTPIKADHSFPWVNTWSILVYSEKKPAKEVNPCLPPPQKKYGVSRKDCVCGGEL